MRQDVRAIANWVIEWANERDIPLSNMAINKIVYFLHAHYLVEFHKPLVSAKIEAWEHGPVFRELYRVFKDFGSQPIEKKATKLNAETGETEICQAKLDDEDKDFLEKLLPRYCYLSASHLRSLSHEQNGPWDKVWNHQGEVNSTMEISNHSISLWFQKAVRH